MSAVVDFPVKPEARPYLDAFGRDDRRRAASRTGSPDSAGASLARFAELGFPSRRSESVALSRSAAALEAPDAAQRARCRRHAAGDCRAPSLAEVWTVRGRLSSGPRRRPLCAGVVDDRATACRASGSGRRRRRSPSGPIWYGPRSKRRRSTPRGRSPRSTPRFSPTASSSISHPGVVARSADRDRPPRRRAAPPARCTRAASCAIGAGSRASIFEAFAGHGSYWRNDVVELRLAAGSRADARSGSSRRRLTRCISARCWRVLGPASRLASFVLLLGGRTVRHEATVRSEGAATHCALARRLCAVADAEEANIVTTVDHARTGRRNPRADQGRRRRARRTAPFRAASRFGRGRPEDRCAPAQPQPDARPARGDRHQARARNLRRRCQVQPRRQRRRSR